MLVDALLFKEMGWQLLLHGKINLNVCTCACACFNICCIQSNYTLKHVRLLYKNNHNSLFIEGEPPARQTNLTTAVHVSGTLKFIWPCKSECHVPSPFEEFKQDESNLSFNLKVKVLKSRPSVTVLDNLRLYIFRNLKWETNFNLTQAFGTY